jgi:hypothetical protein
VVREGHQEDSVCQLHGASKMMNRNSEHRAANSCFAELGTL